MNNSNTINESNADYPAQTGIIGVGNAIFGFFISIFEYGILFIIHELSSILGIETEGKDLNYILEQFMNNAVDYGRVASADNCSDIFTKPLGKNIFKRHNETVSGNGNIEPLPKRKKTICDDFKEKFIPWLNQGHIKFKGLEKFPYVYIVNGVSEFIPTVLTEHSLRPICVEGEYIAYPAYARVLLKSGIKLENKINTQIRIQANIKKTSKLKEIKCLQTFVFFYILDI